MPPRKVRTADKDRGIRKLQWEELYRQKSDDESVDKMRISRTTSNTILNNIWNQLVLQPTNFKQNPTSPDRQLALTLYRLAHGVTYPVLEDVFGIPKESGCIFFLETKGNYRFTQSFTYNKLTQTIGIFSNDTCHGLILLSENIDPCLVDDILILSTYIFQFVHRFAARIETVNGKKI